MADRYQSDDRTRRDPYRDYRTSQEEQFDAGYGYDDDPAFGRMGERLRNGSGGFEPNDRLARERERERAEYRPSLGERFGARNSAQPRNYERYTGADFQSRERARTHEAADRARDALAYGAGSQLAAAHGEWHDPDSFGTHSGTRSPSHRGAGGRGFFERAGDEIAGWFGGHGPSGYTRSDERIRDDVNDRLTDDYRIDARNVTVTVNNGEVTLDGTVTSRDQKRRAEDVVEDLTGVKHVQNNLRVSEATTWDRNNSGEPPTA